MDVDSNNVIALASIIAALAAVVTAGILAWQTRFTVSNQAILQLLAFWHLNPCIRVSVAKLLIPPVQYCACKRRAKMCFTSTWHMWMMCSISLKQ
jgi:hypothetical protein